MKKLILAFLMSLSVNAQDFVPTTQPVCHVKNTFTGVAYYSCPKDQVSIGVQSVQIVGNSIFLYVRCAKQEIVCEELNTNN